MFGEVFTVICALLGIIGLIFLSFFAAGWLRKRFGMGGLNSGKQMIKIRDCVGVAQDKQLIIVTVGRKTMLLGVTPGSVTKLCDLDEDDIAAFETEDFQEESGFMNSLKKAFAKRNGGADGIETENPDGEKDGRNENDDL